MVPSREATGGTRSAQSVTPRLLAVALATAAGLVVATRGGPVGFQALGGSWLLIDWDAIRLPAGITSR
jgi:hypothetical protein